MSASPITHTTFTIERTYPKPPEKVFDAFADPEKKRRWFVGTHSQVSEHTTDFRIGATERFGFILPPDAPLPNAALTNITTYHEIVPNERIVLAYAMELNGRRMSVSLASFEFFPDPAGTRFLFTEQAAFFENSDGPKLREFGWTQLFDNLTKELTTP